MALTITENFSKKFEGSTRVLKFITVTHDESTSTFSAASIGLDHIDFAMAGQAYIASEPADTSTLQSHESVTVTTKNTIGWLLPPKAASITKLIVVGW